MNPKVLIQTSNTMSMTYTILPIGANCTGKTTQCKWLSNTYSEIETISSGEKILEYAITHPENNTALERAVHRVFDKEGTLISGGLLEFEHLQTIVANYLSNTQAKYILPDGVVRTKEQAQAFENILDIREIWYFDHTKMRIEDLVQRSLNRGRKGETKEITLARLKVFEEQTLPLLEHYQQKKVHIFNIDPSGKKEDVHAIINNHLINKFNF